MTSNSNQSTGTPVITENPEDAARLNAAAVGAKAALAAKAAARASNQRPEEPRSRENDFGGPRLKMHVGGTIEGYHLYWENDQDSAIEQLLYEGFEFVTPDEISQSRLVVADGDVAHRVSRFVGTKADGTPLRAYLMKCPDQTWEDREAVRYRQADAWEGAILQSMSKPLGEGQYTPKQVAGSNKLETRARIALGTNE